MGQKISPGTNQEKKVTLIADSLYDTIKISLIEKRVVSNDVFNRLHNVLENSTAYLTFPSLRTSRYSHSLGCMHIAGLIFQQSIINAKSEDRKNFFVEVERIIENAKMGAFYTSVIEHRIPDANQPKAEITCPSKLGESLVSDALYSFITPSSVKSKDNLSYMIVYQAVRLAALLHDIGHPPFSHIIENAINDIYYYLLSIVEKKEPFNEAQKRFFQIITDLKKGPDNTTRNIKIHEVIGNFLSEYVLNDVIKGISTSNKGNVFQSIYDVALISQITLGILNDDIKEAVFFDNKHTLEALHKIVSSDLDADRMDYLLRDLRNSTNGSGLSYDRLLAGYTLVALKNEQKDDEEKFIFEFMPSIQALSTIEEFFRKRFELYKVVISHHHVARTDGLMTEAVFRISTEYLLQPETKTKPEKMSKEISDNYLSPDISWLWKILDLEERKYHWKIANKFFQWDDAWLINCLRRKYVELKAIIIDSQKAPDYETNQRLKSKDPNKIFPILEVLLTNKKNFVSLFKRPGGFCTIDESFLNAAVGDKGFNWDLIYRERTRTKVRDSFRFIQSYLDVYKDILAGNIENIGFPFSKTVEELRISRGFFFNTVLNHMILCGLWTDEKKTNLFYNARNLLQAGELKDSDLFKKTEVIPLFKAIKPGVSDDFHIAVDGRVKRLADCSNIVQQLTLSSNLFPPFFIAVYRYGHEFTESELTSMQSLLGTALWISFAQIVSSSFQN